MLEVSMVGLLTAFAAGIVSFVSPCVLPLVPGYVSYVAGGVSVAQPDANPVSRRLQVLGLSFCFVLGFSTVFVLLGAGVTVLGQLLLAYQYELNIAGGVIIIAFGCFMLGLVRPWWAQRDVRFHASVQGGKPVAAYVLGLAFAFGWTPCIGPVLGAILTVSAATATVSDGVTLLAIYSLGLGVPFLVVAFFTDSLVGKFKAMGHLGRTLQLVAGAIVILMGVAMITGQLSAFSYWLLDAFPALGNVG